MGDALRFRVRVTVVGLLALLVSCGDRPGGGDPTDPALPGEIRVTVTLDGAAAAGLAVAVYAGGGATAEATATTSSSGEATFGGLAAGVYEVAVSVPTGVEVTNGESRRGVSVPAGSAAAVTFVLETAGSSEVVEVEVTGSLQFNPSQLTISPGQTVRWRNAAAMFHTVTPDGHSEWGEVSLSGAGETFTHTFDTPGEFPYYCAPHLSQGMTGVIRVQ
jgi:plastocyanin